jgi:hypothetical protein
MMIDVIWREMIPGKTDRANYKQRGLESIDGVMIHRVGKDHATGADFGDTAEDICRAFTEGPAARYTGHKIPYTFVIEAGGRVAQTLPLSWVGPHALRKSPKWVSVAFIGDFRSHPPTNEQIVSGVILGRMLLGTLALPVQAIKGHTQVPGATADKKKECPGKRFNLYEFKSAVTGGLAL